MIAMQVQTATGTSAAADGDAESRRLSPWVSVGVPVLVFLVARAVSAAFLIMGSARQVALADAPRGTFVYDSLPADPGYLGVITDWDGQWYQKIAVEGYHVPSPGDPTAADDLWAWAFPPAYPMLVRAVMLVTGLPFAVTATIVSLVCGAAAMVLLFRLVAGSGGVFLGIASVVLASTWVSASLLQSAYSESLGLLLLIAFILLLHRERYPWAAAVLFALSLTRIVTLPLAIVVLVHAVAMRRREPARGSRRARALWLALLGALSVAGSFLWLGVASLFIGGDAGMARTSSRQTPHFNWFGDTYAYIGASGILFLVAACLVLVLYSFSRYSAAWPIEMRAWLPSYPVYVLAVTGMGPSILRYLMLAFPIFMLAIGSPRRATAPRIASLVCLAGLGIALGAWYAAHVFVITSSKQLAP